MKFSVIVPIYKVEAYLKPCVESVLNQDYSDYEIILVDDGSPDKCGEICDEFAAGDSRIKVVHKKNGGLSAARNDGMNVAEGEYLFFLDGDDEIPAGALGKAAALLEKNNNPDVLIGNIVRCNGSERVMAADNSKYIPYQDSMDILEINQLYAKDFAQLPWSATQNICKRSFLAENKLFFTKGLIGAEDCDFYMRMIQCVKTYYLTDVNFLDYRINREGSIITTPSFKSIIGQLETFQYVYNMADAFPDSKLMRTYFADRFTNIIMLANLLKNDDEKNECYSYVKKNKDILKYTSNRLKYIFAKFIWKIFGLNLGSAILLKLTAIRKG